MAFSANDTKTRREFLGTRGATTARRSVARPVEYASDSTRGVESEDQEKGGTEALPKVIAERTRITPAPFPAA